MRHWNRDTENGKSRGTETRRIEAGKCGDRKIKRLQHSAFCIQESGFTLLELLISITLIGIIVVVISGAVRLGFRSIEAGERKAGILERKRSSLNIIDSQIQSHMPLTYDADDGAKKFYFTGSRDSMTFTTNYSIWSGIRGYVLIAYNVGADIYGKKTLSAVENTIGTGVSSETNLFEALDDIYFEYYYKGPTDEKGVWIEEWTDSTKVPEKVRMHLVEGTVDLPFLILLRAREMPSKSSGIVFGPN